MDGNCLTASRTAATSALATRLLSRAAPARLATFGTGTLARSHLAAFAHVCIVSEARIRGSSRAKSAPVLRGELLAPGAHVNVWDSS